MMRTNRLTALALTGLLTAFSATAMAASTGSTSPGTPVNSNATKLPGTDGSPTTDRNTSNTQGTKTTPRETGTDVQSGKAHDNTTHGGHGQGHNSTQTTPDGKPVVN